MLITILLALTLFGLCGILHYAVMSSLLSRLPRSGWSQGAQLVAGLYCVGLTYLGEAGLYAVGFALGENLGVGGFKGVSGTVSLMDISYFSLVNYTSLGLGDIYPTGHLSFLAGVESLNGFLLISCSASFIFLLMSDNQSNASAD